MPTIFTTLIQPAELAQRLDPAAAAARLVVFDCSYDLADGEAGLRAYALAHLPGALHIHLERDLGGPKTGRNGRHPLPAREAFAATMARFGVSNDTQVIAYDSTAGMFAARLWWMLRWAGHGAAAVLDGGLPAWQAAGLPVATGAMSAPAASARFDLHEPLVATVDRTAVLDNLKLGAADRLQVVDARAADRFRGENETLDAIGGHIPGAASRPYRDNVDANGRFKSPDALRSELAALPSGMAPARIINQCGSGVSACHNLLAFEVAGLPGGLLYPGSWSEWSAYPDAPVAVGPAQD